MYCGRAQAKSTDPAQPNTLYWHIFSSLGNYLRHVKAKLGPKQPPPPGGRTQKEVGVEFNQGSLARSCQAPVNILDMSGDFVFLDRSLLGRDGIDPGRYTDR